MLQLDLLPAIVQLLPMDITIDPNSNGLPGIGQLRKIVGASMTVGLILAVLALIISAVVWAMGANSSNPHLAGRGKFGVVIALGAAIVTGASVALVNFFRSEEHTSELQSLMRTSYAVFCLKKKKKTTKPTNKKR